MPSVAHFGGACSKKRAEAAGRGLHGRYRPRCEPEKGSERTRERGRDRPGERGRDGPGNGSGRELRQARKRGRDRPGEGVGTDPGKARKRTEVEAGAVDGAGKRRPGKKPQKETAKIRAPTGHKKTCDGRGGQTIPRRRAAARAVKAQKNVRQEGEGKQSARRRDANAHAARTQKNRAAGCTLQPTARSLFHEYTAAPTHRRGGRCPQDYIQRVSIIVGLFEPPTAS